MYKLLLVDDEEIVRKGVRDIIDWRKNGYEICGEASSGEEALDRIYELQPDLVLLDIKMPGITGIDILKKMKEEKNPAKFLILSGYSDFEYAQNAINYGAKGYIVKPIDEDILEEKVINITEEINLERSLHGETNLIERKNKLTRLFISTKITERDEQDDAYFQIVLFNSDLCGFKQRIQQLELKAGEAFSYLDHITFQHDGALVVIMKNENEEAVCRHVNHFVEKLARSADEGYIGAVASIGSREYGLEGLYSSYLQAKKVLEYLFFFNDTYLVSNRDLKITNTICTFVKKSSLLFSYIELYDLINIEKILAEEEEKFHLSGMLPDEAKQICIAVLIDLQNSMKSKYPEKDLELVSSMKLINTIMNAMYFKTVYGVVKKFIYDLAESFANNTSNSTILKVIQYVKINYKDDIKLENLGKMFNCNSAYLGKKFKEYAGMSFNSYLDIIRIETAKDMLINTNLKIYQISSLIGYSNTDYFFMKFKKHTGMTPKEFKSFQKIN